VITVEVNVLSVAPRTWIQLPHVCVELWHDGPGSLAVETRRYRVT